MATTEVHPPASPFRGWHERTSPRRLTRLLEMNRADILACLWFRPAGTRSQRVRRAFLVSLAAQLPGDRITVGRYFDPDQLADVLRQAVADNPDTR